MDASILLPPTGTPLTGIDFVKRLPCGDVERTRRVSAPPVGLCPSVLSAQGAQWSPALPGAAGQCGGGLPGSLLAGHSGHPAHPMRLT